MSDNNARQLDGDVLGEEVGDDELPGVGGFPPDQMLGVNDPNQAAPDDVAMREARTRSEELPDDPGRPGDLLPPDGDDDLLDDEQQALGVEGEDDDDPGEMPAEVAALHVEEE